MDAFAPIPALIGGGLIGLASAILWLGNGRIAGISGVFGQLLLPRRPALWRILFLVTLVAGTWAAAMLVPGLGIGGPGGQPAQLVSAPAWTAIPTPVWLVAAGLLTGAGTAIGNGCTSGHGVCGLARLSPRSLVAVAVFFGVAILTVAVTRIV
ncbi:MAG TPA: YeeE/YedE family protein [Devosiaceae bacterium]|jgi:uncharacterized membrane protein YedE/YeeE|nr:YeeE/YedE family protein [Devosiaceae bacterium]